MTVCLLLLPVWLAGGAELTRLIWLNTAAGPYERNGLVKGRDFVQFYVMGTLAREGAWEELYDVELAERAAARIVPPAAGEVPVPVYAPQVALSLGPLSRLPYLEARWWWLAASAAAYALASWLLMRTIAPLGRYRALAWTTLVLNPALAVLLAVGQTSAFGVLAWAAAAAALSRSRPLLFGACLGLLAYKPPLLVGPVLVLLLHRQWAPLAGLVVCGAAQIASSLVMAGIHPWQVHVAALADVSEYYFLTDTAPHQKHSLLGFFRLLLGTGFPTRMLTGGASLALLWSCAHYRPRPDSVWFIPLMIGMSVLLSPHLYVYDLALLTPALLIAAGALSRRCETSRERAVTWTGYALLFATFSGPLAQQSRIQLSTIVLVMFVIAILRMESERGSMGKAFSEPSVRQRRRVSSGQP